MSLLLFSGFLNKNESFEKAMQKHRGTSLTHVSEVGEGLPYYLPETLTPTWDNRNIVKIPQFTLTNQDGRVVGSEIFDKKISIVSFIFTSCAGFCPVLISKLQRIEREIADKNKSQFVVISVDPEVDTPKQLKVYAQRHGLDTKKNWILLTGSKEIIYNLSRSTFASEVRKIDSQNMRKFAHTEHFYVVDREKRLREIVNGTRIDMPKQAASAIELLDSSKRKL